MTVQETLTIEITTGHCLGGEGNDVCPGQILVAPKDLPVVEAWKKVRMGYARVLTKAQKAGPESMEATGPVTVINQDPSPDHREPTTEAPRRRKSRPRAGRR